MSKKDVNVFILHGNRTLIPLSDCKLVVVVNNEFDQDETYCLGEFPKQNKVSFVPDCNKGLEGLIQFRFLARRFLYTYLGK